MEEAGIPAARPAFVLALLLATACHDPALVDPTPAPLDPVDRTATLVWVVDDADPAALQDALATLAFTTPTTILLDGDLAPDLDDPAVADAAVEAVSDAVADAPRRVDIGVALPVLPPGPASFCIDRRDPRADPAVAARADALQGWLRGRPEVSSVVLDFDAPPRPWEIDCACAACESELPGDQAARLVALFSAYVEPAAIESRALWWGDRATSSDPTVDPTVFMDIALLQEFTDRHLPLRLTGARGTLHPWGRDNPLIDGRTRKVAVDLDPAGARFGAADVPLFLLDGLEDRMRRHRSEQAVGWFVDLGSPERRAAGDLAGEAGLRFIDALYHDQDADPLAVLTEHLEVTVGVGEPLDELAQALRGTGRALDLVAHPLGIGTADFSAGVPATLPLLLVSPADPAWAPRRDQRAVPDRSAAAAVHQWAAAAASIVTDAVASTAAHEDRLEPAAFDALSRGLATLQVWVDAWGVAVDADAAWRRRENSEGTDRAEAEAWLRDDALRLRAAAAAISGAPPGSFTDPLPVDPAGLVALADFIDADIGPGDATARPFPVLDRVAHDQVGDRYTIFWEVTPASGGSVEWGTRWPVYDDGGSSDVEPASRWSAWREQSLPADSRVTYRACAPYEDELGALTVCTSDHSLWTAR